MKITNVQLDIVDNPKGKLRAFCSITLENTFVVKNFKVIEGNHGLFVAMPSRKLTKPCYECDSRVFRNANYCGRCGNKFGKRGDSGHYNSDESHADIAFPIADGFRERLEDRIIREYRQRVNGDKGSVVEHRSDENYDLLDFDYEGHKEKTAEAEQTQEEPAVDASSGEPDEPGTGDLFSDPDARLTSTRKAPPPPPPSSPYTVPETNGSGDEDDASRESLSSLY